MRRVFALALRDRVISSNPSDGIENVEVDDPEPDPLTPSEINQLLAFMRARHPEPIANYFEFAFFTGMPPSELIELRWGDVDWNAGLVRVRRARVLNCVKPPKTKKGRRDIELLERAIAVLRRQKAHTFLLGPDARVFHNPTTRKPWPDEKRQRQTYWQPSLARWRHPPARRPSDAPQLRDDDDHVERQSFVDFEADGAHQPEDALQALHEVAERRRPRPRAGEGGGRARQFVPELSTVDGWFYL
jgi:integrase